TDKLDHRLAIAKKAGAAWIGNPDKTDVAAEVKEQVPELLDVVFECCGKHEAIDNAIDMLKPGGKLLIIGIPEFDRWSFPVDKCRHKEILIQNVRRQNHALEETLDMLDTGKIDISLMPTHRYSFENTKDAFDLVAEYGDGVMKAMIDF
ncbi:MAG: zinc-binding dehydrogenase, partial [Cyclobacteriaceae bacterium]